MAARKTAEELTAEIKRLNVELKKTKGEREQRFIQQNITARKAQLDRLTNGIPAIEKIAKVGN